MAFKHLALLLLSSCACNVGALKLAAKGDGFDGFGTPDPFNQNDDDQVDAGEPNAPDQENPNEDANMVTEDEAADDDDSFVQLASKAKKGDGFDGFGTPDPFNQNDDDQVDAGEPNAPDQENPNEDANMVTEDEAADDDDSFVQVSSKVSKKSDGFDGFGSPDSLNRNDDDEVDAGQPNMPTAVEQSDDDANMVTDDDDGDDDSFVQLSSRREPEDHDDTDGEIEEEEKEEKEENKEIDELEGDHDDADEHDDDDDDDEDDHEGKHHDDDDDDEHHEHHDDEHHDHHDDGEIASSDDDSDDIEHDDDHHHEKKGEKGAWFDGLKPVDGEEAKKDMKDANDEAVKDVKDALDSKPFESDEDESEKKDDDEFHGSDGSFVQVGSKVAKKSDGFDGFGSPDSLNRNDDDEVDAGQPNMPTEVEQSDDDANMVTDDDDSDDDSFVQVASKASKKGGEGFDGFGALIQAMPR